MSYRSFQETVPAFWASPVPFLPSLALAANLVIQRLSFSLFSGAVQQLWLYIDLTQCIEAPIHQLTHELVHQPIFDLKSTKVCLPLYLIVVAPYAQRGGHDLDLLSRQKRCYLSRSGVYRSVLYA